MATTKNFADYIRAELAADPELAGLVAQEAINADIAQQVYDLRTAAGLTQKQLAEKIGSHQSVISRIEDADYDGHSLSLLRRVAGALGVRLYTKFCTEEQRRQLLAKSTSSEVKIVVRQPKSETRHLVGLYYSDTFQSPAIRHEGTHGGGAIAISSGRIVAASGLYASGAISEH